MSSFSKKVFCYVTGICVLLLSCSLEKPMAPQWETTIRLPLSNENIFISEIVEDEEYLQSDSSGIVNFNFEKNFDRFAVGDKLKLDAFSDEFTTEIGLITVESPGEKSIDITLRSIFAQANALDGQYTVVPSFAIDPITQNLPEYANYAWVIIDSGFVVISLFNHLNITLGSPLILKLYDSSNGTLIDQIVYNRNIEPGESFTDTLNLSQKRLSNNLSIEISGQSIGSNGELIQVDANSSFQIQAYISDLKVSEAYARIPSQKIKGTNYFLIQDSMSVTEAKIKSGTIHLFVDKSLAIPVHLNYTLPDFLTPEQESFSDAFYLNSSNYNGEYISLSDFSMQPEVVESGEQRLKINWSMVTDSTDAMVHVCKTDYLQTKFDISEIIFSEVTGVLRAVNIEINPITEYVDIFDDLDSLFLANANLNVDIINGVNFPAETDIVLRGKNSNGKIVDLPIQKHIEAASPQSVATTSIMLTQENSNIADFINNLPKQIEIFGFFKLGDGFSEGTVTQSDYVEGMVKISAPLAFSLTSQTINTDVDTIEIEQETQDIIRENLLSGELFASISNGLPFGVSTELYFSANDTSVYENPDLIVGPIEVNPGVVDESGSVSAPTVTENHITLEKEDLSVFETSSLHMGIKIYIPGTGDQIVKVEDSNYIQVNTYTILQLRINKD